MLFSFAAQISAQENRIFTLEELIPGGKEYDQYVPRIAATYQWQGDRLMVTENDSVWELINPVSMAHRGIIFGMGLAWVVLLGVFLFDLLISRHGWCGNTATRQRLQPATGGRNSHPGA